MQAFGFLTLVILMFMMLEIEIVSSNPCSQFSDPNQQSLARRTIIRLPQQMTSIDKPHSYHAGLNGE
jgi:hypothetical protein